MKCPDCAETIHDDAIKCRFCGRSINEADRRGFPSFYRQVLKHGFAFDRVLDDYANYVEKGGADRLNTENMVGNLLTWGQLDTFSLMNSMQDALYKRAFELVGRKEYDWHGDVPNVDIEKRFREPGNEELKAVYLCGRFLTGIKDFGKAWGDRDPRVDLDMIRFPIDNLKELSEIARRASPPMEDFAQMFDTQVSELERQIASVGEDGRTEGARFREEVLPQYLKKEGAAAVEETHAAPTVDTSMAGASFPWGKFALVGLAIVILGLVLSTVGRG